MRLVKAPISRNPCVFAPFRCEGRNTSQAARAFVEELPREAFGVRPACWRCSLAGGVRKREQAPRTPNASHSSVASLHHCPAISGFARRRRRINAETQRFAEERRERRKKMLFSSALLRALCVSALKLV